MTAILKLVPLVLLLLWAVIAPFVTATLLGVVGLPAQGGAPEQYARIPESGVQWLLGLSQLAALLLGFRLFRSYQTGSGFRMMKVVVVWTVMGITAGLAAAFFDDSLAGIGRLYLAGVAVAFAGGAVLLNFLSTAASPARFLAVLLTAAVVLLAIPQAAMTAIPSLLPAAGAGALVSTQLVVLLCFALAFGLAGAVTRRLFGVGTTGMDAVIGDVFWIVATHALWLILLFASGAAVQVPRWLPAASIPTMLVPMLAMIALQLRRGTDLHGPGGHFVSPLRFSEPGVAAVVVNAQRKPEHRCAWIISYTGVSNEPRVLRQAEALQATGWDVVVCGHDGHSERPKGWTFVRLPSQDAYRSSFLRLLGMARSAAVLLVRRGGGSLAGKAALFHHHTVPLWMHTRHELLRVLETHPELMPDLVLSHDWHTAEVGYALAQRSGARFSIDCHEYAPGQYFNDPVWVRNQRPITVAVQDFYLRRADIITVVCEGIANLLALESPLRRPPVVIRSVPFKNAQPFRPVGKRITVLYHGDLSRRREIHTAIASMPLWRDDIDLVLRGSGDPAYIGELKRLVERHGLGHRVTFEPPVPFAQIVPAANKADIGFFSFTGDSPQIRFTLPNKLFEYVMAGLALCISDQEEVARIVKTYGNGKLIADHSPEGIAATINSFTREEIEACKRASIAAAGELSWEVEREKLLDAYRQIVAA